MVKIMTLLQAFPSSPPPQNSRALPLSNTWHVGCRTGVRITRKFLLASDSAYESIAYDPVKTRLLEEKTGEPEKKNFSVQGRETATKPTNIRSRRRNLNLDHTVGWWVLSPLLSPQYHPCSLNWCVHSWRDYGALAKTTATATKTAKNNRFD